MTDESFLVSSDLRTPHYAAALDALSVGVVVLSESGQIHFQNRAFSAIADEVDGLSVSAMALSLCDRNEDEKFRNDLRSVCQSSPGKAEVRFKVSRPSGNRPYGALLKRLPYDPGAPPADGQSLAMVCIKNTLNGSRNGSRLLQEIWGLSKSESELALALAYTGTLQAAAAERGITEGSARQYIKRIFHKTLAKGQVDLVALILEVVAF